MRSYRLQRQQSDVPSQQAEQPPPASTYIQPDVAQDATFRRQLERRPARHDASWKSADDKRVPKANLINRTTKIVAASTPQKVLEQNKVRSDLEIGNNTGAIILLNYGQPTIATGGLPIANNGMFVRQGLACPDNEIWITSSIVGGVVTVYEGIPQRGIGHDHDGG